MTKALRGDDEEHKFSVIWIRGTCRRYARCEVLGQRNKCKLFARYLQSKFEINVKPRVPAIERSRMVVI